MVAPAPLPAGTGLGAAAMLGLVPAIGDAAAAASGVVVPAVDSACFSHAAKKRHVTTIPIEVVTFIKGIAITDKLEFAVLQSLKFAGHQMSSRYPVDVTDASGDWRVVGDKLNVSGDLVALEAIYEACSVMARHARK